MTAAVIAMTDEDYAPRYCADRILGGQVEHDFLKSDLQDESLRWLIPRCQGGAARPIPQPRMDVSTTASPRVRVCVPCASLRRRDRIVRYPLVWRRSP